MSSQMMYDRVNSLNPLHGTMLSSERWIVWCDVIASKLNLYLWTVDGEQTELIANDLLKWCTTYDRHPAMCWNTNRMTK